MTSITETTGFTTGSAMPSHQPFPTAVSGTGLCGRVRVLAWSGKDAAAGGTTGGFGGFAFRLPLSGSRVEQGGNGSAVSAESELALDRGEPMVKHAEATRRRYGASGECPRRLPA